jgi:urease subunit alpha
LTIHFTNGINRALNLKRMVRPVKNIRQLSKADMKNNSATPKLPCVLNLMRD